MIRISRVWAIARRDLASELKGRQGLLLPAVIMGLLLPASLVPSPVEDVSRRLEDDTVHLLGDVPMDVRGAEAVRSREEARFPLRFEQRDGVLLVDGPVVPPSVRESLDGDDAVVPVHTTPRGYLFPGRTALLSLIAASTLTGAVSASIGGERSRRTLVVLLAAAVTRSEIVLGKWVAWGGLGATAALLGALVAMLSGHVKPGLWLIALPTVPMGTVAIGLWLVRRAGDVMAGSATALRVLPAVLSMAGVVSWLLGDRSPWLGALVPLGGALLAAGDTWPAAGPKLLAAASTLVMTAAALILTIRDLEESPDESAPEDPMWLAGLVGVLAAAIWWPVVAGPELWALAGNAKVTAALPVATGVATGAGCFLAMSAIRAARSHRPSVDTLSLRLQRREGGSPFAVLAYGAVGGLALCVLWWLAPSFPRLDLAPFTTRLEIGFQPTTIGLGLAVLVADELLFRGWLLRSVGPVRATVVFAAVRAPFDPLSGLLQGAVCAFCATQTGSVWASLLARGVLLTLVVAW